MIQYLHIDCPPYLRVQHPWIQPTMDKSIQTYTHTHNSRKLQKAELEFVEPTIIYIVFITIYMMFTLN